MTTFEHMQGALDNTLTSTNGGALQVIMTVTNKLPIPITPFFIDDAGLQWPAPNDLGAVILPGQTAAFYDVQLGYYYLFRASCSGSFVCLLLAETDWNNKPKVEIEIDHTRLQPPDHIGPVPQPIGHVVIPPDMPRVLVGCGKLGDHWVTREQYWKRAPDSYVLAPKTERTVSTTSFAGRQKTSSTTENFQKALGFSSSTSWAVVSASLSASVSSNSTHFQQVVTTNEVTQYESVHLVNEDEEHALMYLKWQLMDIVTLFHPHEHHHQQKGIAKPIASMATARNPTIIAGPYTLSKHGAVKAPAPRARGIVPGAR
jgi:hypothetical protein